MDNHRSVQGRPKAFNKLRRCRLCRPQICLIFAFLFFSSIGDAQVRVIEEAAIPYTGFLSKADFDQRFPGTTFDDQGKVQSGWYVVYQHQALNYCFGPMALESTGRDYLVQLRSIVDEVVRERPSIQDYSLELKQLPAVLGEGASSGSDAQSNESSQNGESGINQPEAPPSRIWGFIKRLFGM